MPNPKVSRLAFAVLLLVGLAGVCLHPAIRWRVVGWYRGESFYQGRPTSYWAEEIRNWRSPEERWTRQLLPEMIADWFEHDGLPAEAFCVDRENSDIVPPEAIPVLVDLLGRGKDEGSFAAGRISVATFKKSPHATRQAVRSAVPRIVEILRSPSCKHREYPLNALACIGPDAEAAVPALIEVIRGAQVEREDQVMTLFSAVYALDAIGPGVREAIPVLEELRDGEAGRKSVMLDDIRVSLRDMADNVIRKLEDKDRPGSP